MSATLTYNDSITRIGYTTIDGVMVMQHTCTIQADNPEEMSVSSIKVDQKLYKENREICRADIAEFEDLAYQVQDKYIAEKEVEEKQK